MADLFCSQNVPEHVVIDCGIDKAGIVAAAFVDTSIATPSVSNLEDDSWWTALTGASPQTAFVVLKTRGEYASASPTEEDGFGRESTQVTGASHEATLEFEGIDENRDFVEGINRRKWKVALVTNGDKVLFIDVPVTVYGRLNVPRGIDTSAYWMLTLKWKDYSNPIVADIPATVFDEP